MSEAGLQDTAQSLSTQNEAGQSLVMMMINWGVLEVCKDCGHQGAVKAAIGTLHHRDHRPI